MPERPILFSAPMVRALLDGSKTQTRRIVKPQPGVCDHGHWPDAPAPSWKAHEDGGWYCSTCGNGVRGPRHNFAGYRCPYGVPGDLLWVRESFAATPDIAATPYLYRADLDDDGTVPYLVSGTPMGGGVGNARVDRWRPSIHMPRRASRITLQITDVRVERLKEISVVDCYAEGCFRPDPTRSLGSEVTIRDNARGEYRRIWKAINGPGSWDANPWVWAVSFERVTP